VETFQQSPVEVNFPFLLVADNAWVSQDRQHLVALEAGINSVKSPQAADHQTSANQQGQRQRDLRNHQRLSQAEAQRAGWRAAFATFENWIQIDPLRNQGGRKSKQDARQQGARDSERQRSPIKREANIGIAHFADQGGHQHARAPFCQEQPKLASEQGKQQAFCQQLTDQAPATCANSQTYGDLFSPGNCALQQQPRDIDCSDEQNNGDDRRQNSQPQSGRFRQIRIPSEPCSQSDFLRARATPVNARRLRQRPLINQIQLSARLLHPDARLEPRYDLAKIRGAADGKTIKVFQRKLIAQGQRQNHLG